MPTNRTRFVGIRKKTSKKGTNQNHIRALSISGVTQMGILGDYTLICRNRIDET